MMLTFLASVFKSFKDALARQIGETSAKWFWLVIIPLVSSGLGLKYYLADNSSSNTYSNAPAPAYTVTQIVTTTPTPAQSSTSEVTETPSPETTPENTPKASDNPSNNPEPSTKSTNWSPNLNDAATVESCAWPGNTGYSWSDIKRIDSYISIAKQPYSEGFSCQMMRNMASGYVDLAVPQGANTFSVIAGQSDSSHDTDIIVTFEVVDAYSGEILQTSNMSIGESVSFTVDVSSITRIRLRVTADAGPGVESTKFIDTRAVWANPTFS
jgi:laminin G, domain-containing 2